MYAIKVLSTKSDNSWYLMRDMTDFVVYCYGRKSKADAMVNELIKMNPKMRIEVTENIGGAVIKRSNDKRSRLDMENKK